MKSLKYITFLLLLNVYNARSEALDSLLNKAATYRSQDTVRATVLNNLAIELSSSDFELGLKFADSSIILSKEIGSDKSWQRLFC